MASVAELRLNYEQKRHGFHGLISEIRGTSGVVEALLHPGPLALLGRQFCQFAVNL